MAKYFEDYDKNTFTTSSDDDKINKENNSGSYPAFRKPVFRGNSNGVKNRFHSANNTPVQPENKPYSYGIPMTREDKIAESLGRSLNTALAKEKNRVKAIADKMSRDIEKTKQRQNGTQSAKRSDTSFALQDKNEASHKAEKLSVVTPVSKEQKIYSGTPVNPEYAISKTYGTEKEKDVFAVLKGMDEVTGKDDAGRYLRGRTEWLTHNHFDYHNQEGIQRKTGSMLDSGSLNAYGNYNSDARVDSQYNEYEERQGNSFNVNGKHRLSDETKKGAIQNDLQEKSSYTVLSNENNLRARSVNVSNSIGIQSNSLRKSRINDKKLYTGNIKLEKTLQYGCGTNSLNTADSRNVKALQQKLIDLGYLDSSIPFGYFGKKTRDAVNLYKNVRMFNSENAYNAMVGNQLWAYLGMNIDISEKAKEKCDEILKSVWKKVDKQYILGRAAVPQKMALEKVLFDNRQYIIDIGNELAVPPEIIASVIIKERITQSAPDFVLYSKSFFDKGEHSYGNGAIFADTAIKAWKDAGQLEELIQYMWENYQVSSSNIKRCVETMLMDDNIFSIYSIAYVLKHKAKQLGIDQNLFKADYSQLKNVLSAYNSGDAAYNNPEGEKYGTYTLEYAEDMRAYLYGAENLFQWRMI